METKPELAIVLVTAGSPDEAERLASSLVEERLAACVNIVGPIRSIYRWQGAVQRDEEHLLIIKTKLASFPQLTERVGQLHSYDTPEVIALPITGGSSKYLEWLLSAAD